MDLRHNCRCEIGGTIPITYMYRCWTRLPDGGDYDHDIMVGDSQGDDKLSGCSVGNTETYIYCKMEEWVHHI